MKMFLRVAPRLCSNSAVRTPSKVGSTPLRTQIAVVGSGPSGCYVAHLLTKKRDDIHVDIFERLPVPFGLCRYGVAPDHPEVKNVEQQFLNMFKSGRVTWIGNVTVGKGLSIEALLEHYTAVVLATGAEGSRKLHIPGEELGGVVSAGDFVRYYNTYPFPHGAPHFCPFALDTARKAVVIGNGNVAMDCVRVLAASYKYFAPTDMNCAAIRELMKNRIHHISVVARRSHAHSAFTISEFRELTRFQPEMVRVSVEPFDLEEALRVPATNPRARRRLLELVARFADTNNSGGNINNNESPGILGSPEELKMRQTPRVCSVHLRYNLRPVRFLPHPERHRHVGAVVFERTDVDRAGDGEGGTEQGTQTVTMPCDVAITSIGHHSESIPGVEFDHGRGVIAHERGRVKGQPRLYCAGWIKNGPKGVILQSLMDAQETVSAILDDLENKVIPTHHTKDGDGEWGNSNALCGKYGLIDYFVQKKMEPVSVSGLERILYVEAERGVDLGKRLEKIDNVRAMLDVAMGGSVGKKANNAFRGIMNERPDALLYLNELLDDTTDLAPLARQLAKELPPVMAAKHPPGSLHPSQL